MVQFWGRARPKGVGGEGQAGRVTFALHRERRLKGPSTSDVNHFTDTKAMGVSSSYYETPDHFPHGSTHSASRQP
jgi:hypothetical protein